MSSRKRWLLLGTVLFFGFGSLGWYSATVDEPADLTFPALQCERPGNHKLIVFVHGWNGDRSSWRDFPELACLDPALKSADVLTTRYPTFLRRHNANLIDLADWLNTEFDNRNYHQRYTDIVLIAHSMGGLLARQMVLLKSIAREPHSFRLIVSIGTPHDGAEPAGIARALGISSTLTRQLKKDSQFLQQLSRYWKLARNNEVSTYCLASPQDRVVPKNSALKDCDDGTTYPQWKHRELVRPAKHEDPRYSMPMAPVIRLLG